MMLIFQLNFIVLQTYKKGETVIDHADGIVTLEVSLNIFISQLEQYPKVIHCGSSRGGDVYYVDL